MTADTVWTIKRLLDWTVEYFAKNESIQPRLDAEILLAEALGCQRIELYTRFEEEVAAEPRAIFRDWVKRRADGVPVAYLVGHREFFSLEFEVNEHVLIPRPETEHLVTTVLDLVSNHFREKETVRIVDVGTGSGCIAISIAKHCEKAIVNAVDISSEALELAARNVAKHDLNSRVTTQLGDLLDSLEQPESIEIVVSNPPYIGTREESSLPVDVKDNEPHVALFSGEEGLELSQKLMRQMIEKRCGHYLVMESSPLIIERLAEFAKSQEFSEVEIRKDFGGLQRWITAKLS